MLRKDHLARRLHALLEQVARAAGLLDEGQLQEAGALAELTIEELTCSCGADWQRLSITLLLPLLGKPERGRALARALWVASTVDEMSGRDDLARLRCRRAMELYARLRLVSEEVDVRAALDLGSASARWGATRG